MAEMNPITELKVSGFKSIRAEQSIEIRPLTILAGANSSGKSSIIQPLLLLKQTLEVLYDPGTLLIDGVNVKFSDTSQIFFNNGIEAEKQFSISLSMDKIAYSAVFSKGKQYGLQIDRSIWKHDDAQLILLPEMSNDDIGKALEASDYLRFTAISDQVEWKMLSLQNKQTRFFLDVRTPEFQLSNHFFDYPGILRPIQLVIHVPGLRGTPQRTYPITGTGPNFPGTFDPYTASLILKWGDEKSPLLTKLGEHLRLLGLTSSVEAKLRGDTQVELFVGRLPHPTPNHEPDLVNIADVGFGVSQTLPVLVALLVAEPGQFVYLEQPELHLHPRAQVGLATILVEAANRGVRVVLETHSSLLLTGIQTLVAGGTLAADKVKLHWFTRDAMGETKVSSAELDRAGTFGEWPEDFTDVELEAQSEFIDAADLVQSEMVSQELPQPL